MTLDHFFDKVVEHYIDAEKITPPYAANGNVFRNRQHSISSTLEDLFAHFLSCQLRGRLPNLPFCLMVDYRICPDNSGNPLYPDIAIILEQENKPPCMVAYLDVKADLGFKREYFNSFPAIAESINRLRQSKNIGTKNYHNNDVVASANLKWRTVVLSDKNIATNLLQENMAKALKWESIFKLYFLSHGHHPNSKLRSSIKPVAIVFENLIEDIVKDIEPYL